MNLLGLTRSTGHVNTETPSLRGTPGPFLVPDRCLGAKLGSRMGYRGPTHTSIANLARRFLPVSLAGALVSGLLAGVPTAPVRAEVGVHLPQAGRRRSR